MNLFLCIGLLLIVTSSLDAFLISRSVPVHQLLQKSLLKPSTLVKIPLFDSTADSTPSQLPKPTENIESSIDHRKSSNLVKLFYRSAWVCWWVQIILTVISGVILTYANTVRQTGPSRASIWISGFSLSVISAIVSAGSCFWTWNTARSSIRLEKVEYKKVALTLRRYCQTAVGMSLFGIFINIIGAEQIAGSLTSKILSAQTLGGLLTTNQVANSFQPLDIFLVQANTNVLLSHFASVLCFILLQTQM
jgi:hypothetical protein